MLISTSANCGVDVSFRRICDVGCDDVKRESERA